MKHYYAKQLTYEDEYFNYENYYNEDDAVEDKFWAGGNRDFCDINAKLINNLVRNLEYMLDDIDRDVEEEHCKVPTLKIIRANMEYYFKKQSEEKFTQTEVKKFKELADKYFNANHREENDILCELLEIIYEEPFINGTLRGSCQDDWLEYICPAKMRDRIDWIESVIFATGTEFAISEEPLENSEDMDISNFTIAYTDKWHEEDVRAWAANIAGCKPEEMKLLLVENTYTTVHHNYKEV